MIEEIRKKAKELLESGKVDVVIGYGNASQPNHTTPVFILKPDAVEQLVWNEHSDKNLAIYLRHPSLKRFAKKAVIAKPCDIKSIVSLIQENQFPRESVYIIGVACDGIKDPETGEQLPKCVFALSITRHSLMIKSENRKSRICLPMRSSRISKNSSK
jgi:formate dehydrogenase subunit beta